MFTDYYAENSCTRAARRSSPARRFTAQGCPRSEFRARPSAFSQETLPSPKRSSRSAMPPASSARTISAIATKYLPTVHGFDEFFGNLYHLNAEEEPERPNYPKDDAEFVKFNSPRGVLRCKATDRDDQPSIRRTGSGKQTSRIPPAQQEAHGDDR